MFPHPELLVPSIIGLLAVLYPIPWHVRTGNIATLSMAFWLTTLNLLHIINCIVWSDNAEIKAKGWFGENFGLPLAHTLLAKQLESLTSLRLTSSLYDENARRKQRRFDLLLSVSIPITGILVHLSMMNRRFYLVQSVGPVPATYWNGWAVCVMAIIPILMFAATATFMVMAIVNITVRKRQLDSFLSSGSSLNKDQFYRLLFLSIAELASCSIRAIWNLMSFENGPQPLGLSTGPQHSFTLIESVQWADIPSVGHVNLKLQFFTVVACSFVFFLCFCTTTETRRFYFKVVRKVIPCLPESRSEQMSKMSGSLDSNNSSRPFNSNGFNSKTDLKDNEASGFGGISISMDAMVVVAPPARHVPKPISINRGGGGAVGIGSGGGATVRPGGGQYGMNTNTLEENPYIATSPYREKRVDSSIA